MTLKPAAIRRKPSKPIFSKLSLIENSYNFRNQSLRRTIVRQRVTFTNGRLHCYTSLNR